jgi:ribosomal protein S18 acetylase RimI-like enzyme
MISLRPLRWPADQAELLALDTSFTTDRVFQLQQAEHGVNLDEVTADPPFQKSYSFASGVAALPGCDWVKICEHDNEIAGVAAVTIEGWNRRAVLNHLYVSRKARRMRVGHALVTAALEAARDLNARCLWVETQTTNYPAVQFYRSMGFVWCGFDTSLYDPNDVGSGEVALFFSRDIGLASTDPV